MSYIKCLEEVFFVKTSNTISKHRAYLYKPFRSLQSVGWVPGRGIEPPRVAPYGPEPYASTNFAIQATPLFYIVPETGIESFDIAQDYYLSKQTLDIHAFHWCNYTTKSEPILNRTDGAFRAPN